jgi:mannose-6-phosphate isomerase-like protein (cupin superfamily)
VELIRFDEDQAQPLPGGINASYIAIRTGDRTSATLLNLEKHGDTGMRETDVDMLLAVVSGAGQVRSGGMVAEVRPGDVMLLPGGKAHTIWTTDTRMRALLMLLGSGAYHSTGQAR